MSPVGVTVTVSESPPTTNNQFYTATAFMVGQATWGRANTAVLCLSLGDVVANFGAPGPVTSARAGSFISLYDAADLYFRLGGSRLYVSRPLGVTPVAASLTLRDNAAAPTLVVTADDYGTGGNGINVAVTVSGGNFTITLTDSVGNTLISSGLLANQAAAIAWGATSGLVTITASTGGGASTLNPATLTATPLAGGTSDPGTIGLAQLTTALTAFGPELGPGQVSVPGVTNTAVNGVWSALALHASTNNRVALCDMDDGQTPTTLTTAKGSFGTSGIASWSGFWAGNVVFPGTVPNTTRSVPPSVIISALCARVDATGNPNRAAAGLDFSFEYASQLSSTYTVDQINTLNAAGINVFNTLLNRFVNYGFVSAVSSSLDPIFWELSAVRLRMAIQAFEYTVGQRYLFDQIDGAGLTTAKFGADLGSELVALAIAGALYVRAPDGTVDQGFVVEVGPSVNTPQTIAAGHLKANVAFRASPFAQMVEIALNAVPVTQPLT